MSGKGQQFFVGSVERIFHIVSGFGRHFAARSGRNVIRHAGLPAMGGLLPASAEEGSNRQSHPGALLDFVLEALQGSTASTGQRLTLRSPMKG